MLFALVDSVTAQVKPWAVLDTKAGQKGHLGSLSGMVGLLQTAYMPIVWQIAGMIAIVEKEGVGNWPGLVLIVGVQSVERKPVVRQ